MSLGIDAPTSPHRPRPSFLPPACQPPLFPPPLLSSTPISSPPPSKSAHGAIGENVNRNKGSQRSTYKTDLDQALSTCINMHKFLDKKRSTETSKDCSTSFMLSQLPVFPAPLLSPPPPPPPSVAPAKEDCSTSLMLSQLPVFPAPLLSPPPPPPPPPKFAPTNHNEGINHEEGSERSTDVGFDTSSQGSESDDQSVDESSRKAKSDFLKRIGFSALNALDSNGKSALHIAAKEGNAEVTRALLDDEDFQHVNAKDKSILKWTVLHEAAAAGNVKIVKILMQHTRFVKSDTRDRNGRTCLHLAAIHGSFGAVKAIVRDPLFASIGVKDHLGYTPQQRASDNGHEVIADFIGACVPSQKPPGLEICPRK